MRARRKVGVDRFAFGAAHRRAVVGDERLQPVLAEAQQHLGDRADVDQLSMTAGTASTCPLPRAASCTRSGRMTTVHGPLMPDVSALCSAR